MKMNKGRAFGYTSTTTKETSASAKAQEDSIMAEFSARHEAGYAWAGFYGDRACEAALASRPAGMKLLAACCPGDLVLCASAARMFSDAETLLWCCELFRRRAVRLVLADLPLDTGDVVGQGVLALLGSLRSWEKQRRREGVMEARQKRRSAGLSCGVAPPGFETAGSPPETYYQGCPKQRAVMGEVYAMSRAPLSDHQILWHMTASNAPPFQGKKWGLPLVRWLALAEEVLRQWEEVNKQSLVGRRCPAELVPALRESHRRAKLERMSR